MYPVDLRVLVVEVVEDCEYLVETAAESFDQEDQGCGREFGEVGGSGFVEVTSREIAAGALGVVEHWYWHRLTY